MTCRAQIDAILTADGDAAGDGPGTGTDTPVIFMGDLNDEPLAATTQRSGAPVGRLYWVAPTRGPHSR